MLVNNLSNFILDKALIDLIHSTKWIHSQASYTSNESFGLLKWTEPHSLHESEAAFNSTKNILESVANESGFTYDYELISNLVNVKICISNFGVDSNADYHAIYLKFIDGDSEWWELDEVKDSLITAIIKRDDALNDSFMGKHFKAAVVVSLFVFPVENP